MSCWTIFGRWGAVLASPLCSVVLSVLRGAGMASDRTEVTVVLSVLARSVRRAHSCQSRCAWLGSTSLRSSQGSGRRKGREPLCGVRLRQKGGVVADPVLSV
jgi:uncharacterized membrane protein YraQ (UPF0718 family)